MMQSNSVDACVVIVQTPVSAKQKQGGGMSKNGHAPRLGCG